MTTWTVETVQALAEILKQRVRDFYQSNESDPFWASYMEDHHEWQAASALTWALERIKEAEQDGLFKAGVRASFNHMKFFVANNYHMRPETQSRLDEINDILDAASEDALNELDPVSAAQWKELSSVLQEKAAVVSERDAANARAERARVDALEEAASYVDTIPPRYPDRKDQYCKGAGETAEYIANRIRALKTQEASK